MKPVSTVSARLATFRLYGLFLTLFGCSLGPEVGPQSVSDPTTPSHVADGHHDPTAAKVAQESKSLELSANWSPPRPTRTAPARPSPRVEPSHAYGVPTRAIGLEPTDAEIGAVTFFPEPLRPLPGVSSKEETRALAGALREIERPSGRATAKLRRFVDTYPASRWAPALHLNLGALSYHEGYFQRALTHWRAAWDLAKGDADPVATRIANAGLAHYAKMNARVGRMSELDAVLAEASTRTFTGDARVKMSGAVEGLWMMRSRPGVSFRCGPYALLSVAGQLDPTVAEQASSFLARTQSTSMGFSLAQVRTMATDLGVRMRMAKREPGAEVVVPAVVHWKVGHFGALVREVDGRYLLKDPTFGNDTWITRDALDEEASGYFLVAAGPPGLPRGWTRATEAEASEVYGKGHSGTIGPDETGPDDEKVGGGDGDCAPDSNPAMARYQIHALAASLHIRDTPVGYAAAVGPDVRVRVAYNQRESDQPSTMDFSNFGPQFVSNWVSYLVDDTNNPVGDVKLRKRGGGGEVHKNFDSGTQTFARQPKTGAVLSRLLPANTYKLVYPDGRTEFYEHSIGTTGFERKVFLTRVQDAHGREVSIEYDTDPEYPARIHRLVDATGQQTVFQHAYAGHPYLVTAITDPFGRAASFTYALLGAVPYLQSITDTIGIVSSFEYNDSGEIIAMTTPYGTTRFELSPLLVDGAELGYSLIRYVEVTDPLGQKERLEYNTGSQLTGVPGALETPLPQESLVKYTFYDNDDRNTFYWDKLAMRLAPGDYAKAHRYHWVQPDNSDTAVSILESEVPALESRIFYNYPGQPEPYIQGTLTSPSVIARVVKDAGGVEHTQATKFEYNAQGNRTKTTDPLGRQTLLEYASNGVDVVATKQRTGGTPEAPVWTTVSTATYGGGAPAHLPSSTTDGAGQTTAYTYTALGQIATITNPKSEVTTFTYDANPASAAYGRVLTITGAVPGGDRTFTYDGYGRVLTTTSDGHTLTYDYDALDRVRTITYPDGSFEQMEYEDQSLVASRDREGRWTRHQVNRLQERVVTQDPALRTTQFQWCRCGQLRKFVDGNGNVTEWQRDEASRVNKKVYANGSFETTAYDFSGRLVSTVDPMGRTVTYEHALDNRITKRINDPATADVLFSYDALFPRLTSRQDGAGTTTFAYHPYGALGAGQLALENGPLPDDTQKHTYDELGRPKKLQLVDDATQLVVSYSEESTYDSRGRVTTVANNLGTTAYTFAGQSSRPTTVAYPNGMLALYDYFDATGDNLLKQIKNLSAPPVATISQFDTTYRADRAIGTWTVDQGSGASAWTFGYDASRQLTSAERRAGATLLASHYYGYDKAGNRVQVGTGQPARTAPTNYDVGSLNQLLSSRDHGPTTFAGTVDEPATVKVNGAPAKVMSTGGAAPFRFEAKVNLAVGANTVVVEAKDGSDNVATKTYAVTTTGTSTTFEHDDNGNLTYEKLPGGAVVRELRWDQQNRLVRELHGTHESVYAYDGESRRVRIKELTGGVETKNETFVWCGSRICQKRAGNGATVLRSYFSQGFEEAGPPAVSYLYTRDHLGSVREVIANDGTTVATRMSYDPWGKATETGAGAKSDFGFTGHYIDRPTGLALAWWRGYDPGLGRWLSMDPIGLEGGLNLYGYAENDSPNKLDQYGLDPTYGECKTMAFGELNACRAACNAGESLLQRVCRAAGLADARQSCLDSCAREFNYQIDACGLTWPYGGSPPKLPHYPVPARPQVPYAPPTRETIRTGDEQEAKAR